jgi:TonB family protein
MRILKILGMLAICSISVSAQLNREDQVSTKIFLEAEDVTRSYLENPIKPAYPEAAEKAAIQGEVLMFVTFDQNGKLIETKALRSPDEALSQAVVDALEGCKIKPHSPLHPDAIYHSELRFIFSLSDGKPKVSEAPAKEQRVVSKEFTQEIERRRKKDF